MKVKIAHIKIHVTWAEVYSNKTYSFKYVIIKPRLIELMLEIFKLENSKSQLFK